MQTQSFQRLRAAFVAAFVLASVGALAAPPAAGAAKSAPGANPGEVLIRKLSDLNREYRQRAKSIDTRANAKPREWGVFDVTFQTVPEWIDGLTISYTVILQNPKAKQGEPQFSLFQTTVEYPDVARGNDHRAGVVLKPTAMERFGLPIGFAVQIFVAGEEIVAESVEGGPLKGRPKWWIDPQIVDSAATARRDGYLTDRAKSPFQLVDVDTYEVSR